MTDALHERGQALENEFFRRVDRDLLDRIKRQELVDSVRETLARETGILDELVLNEMIRLGVRGENILALGLVPLVRVAWCDGDVTESERGAVLESASQRGCPSGSDAYQLLEKWMTDEPNQTLADAWQAYIAELKKTLSDDGYEALKKDLLKRAEQVAEAAGGLLGLGTVSASERKAIDSLRESFP